MADKTAKVDRSMFEDTPIRKLKTANKADDERAGSSNRTSNIKLKNGKNTIRLAPKFKGEASFIIQRKSTWMSVTGNEGDLVRRPVNDSKLHGGTALDIIQEYFRIAAQKLGGSKAGQAKLAIFADRDKGLATKVSYVAHVWQRVEEEGVVSWHFGEYEFTKSVRDGIDSAAVAEDEDEEITVDPYTPIKTGRCIIITYNNQAKVAKDYYKVGISSKATPLTEEMLSELAATTSLTSKYRGTYKLRDFEQALDGLEKYDGTHGLDICETAEWEEAVEKVRAQYESSEDDTDDDDDSPKSKKAKAKLAPAKKKRPVDDDDEDDDNNSDEDDEGEEEEPAPKEKVVAAPVKKKAPVEEDEDEDDEDEDDDDTPPFDTDDDDDEDDDETPPPAKKNTSAISKVKETLKKKK